MKSETKKILVIRFSSLGDVMLTLPLITALRNEFPKANIDYLTKEKYAEVLKFNPNLNSIIEADDYLDFKGLKQLKTQLKQSSYDLVIDAHNNLRTFYLKLFLTAQKLTFKKYSVRKFLFVRFKLNLMKKLPTIAQRYINILSPLLSRHEENFDLLPEICADDTSKQKAGNILGALNIPAGRKLICICPASMHFTKTYPVENYIELIEKFDRDKFAFILAGKGNDKKSIEKIVSSFKDNVYDLCDKLNIPELTVVMKRCDLVICGDTGPMHIAEGLDKPLIVLAGSSVKEFGFYPQGINSVVLENNNLNCRPCSHIGRDYCPKGHFKCMNEISPGEVYLTAMKTFS